ncbi:MAG: D-cysteine desulfhydrase family protein [Anaerolineales bacterium]|nr:D-cysteine desulfhydrase family protein [Anaerolineales bacterium]
MPARFPLALLPTPLVEAPRLSQALGGPRLLIKRDDLTGFALGGNKVRGLEYYLAEALAQGADVLVTGAGPQSNHVRVTVAAARVAGLEAVAVIHGERPPVALGNLLLDELLGAELRFTGSPDRAQVDVEIERVGAELAAAGRRPYLIPRGGASALGALGYLAAVSELGAQLAELGARPAWLVLATGSCGTQAGLLAGIKLFGAPYRLLGITVSRPVAECCERITRLAIAAAALAESPITVLSEDVVVRDGYIGAGYGIPSPEAAAAIRLAARTEGLFLDPTYTGKGLAGLIGEIKSGRLSPDDTVIYLHTGGEPGLLAHPEVAGLEALA